MKLHIIEISILLLLISQPVKSDLPVHCLAGMIEGTWIIHMTNNESDNSLKCGHEHPDLNLDHLNSFKQNNFRFKQKFETIVSLERPNIVLPSYSMNKKDSLGYWTMVYDEGFEINIKDITFFAFSRYEQVGKFTPTNSDTEDTPGYKSICDKTFIGWYRNRKTNENWGCFWAEKVNINELKNYDLNKIDYDNIFQHRKIPLKKDKQDTIKIPLENNNIISRNSPNHHNFKPNTNSHLHSEMNTDLERLTASRANNLMDKILGQRKNNSIRQISQVSNYNSGQKAIQSPESSILDIATALTTPAPNYVDFLKSLLNSSNTSDEDSMVNVPHLDIYFMNNLKEQVSSSQNTGFLEMSAETKLFTPDLKYVDKINNPDNNYKWEATVYPEFIGKSYASMRTLLGNSNSVKGILQSQNFVNSNQFLELEVKENIGLEENSSNNSKLNLPSSFSWMNVDGVSYDSPIRKQGECGSCYAIAMISVFESRIRIKSNNRLKPFLSTSSIIGCSRANQGCSGGYPFLVGKFAMEMGLVEESCQPYNEEDKLCKNMCFEENIWKAKDYGYVGNYYGGCSEEKMMEEIYKNGPIVVAINATPELYYYKAGIFHSDAKKVEGGAEKNVKGWEYTNHAVVAIGWGEEYVKDELEKFWILKNSWGDNWGEKGYFRISKGKNMASVEAQGIYVVPDI